MKKIFQTFVFLHGTQSLEWEVDIDTTVQEKNITSHGHQVGRESDGAMLEAGSGRKYPVAAQLSTGA